VQSPTARETRFGGKKWSAKKWKVSIGFRERKKMQLRTSIKEIKKSGSAEKTPEEKRRDRNGREKCATRNTKRPIDSPTTNGGIGKNSGHLSDGMTSKGHMRGQVNIGRFLRVGLGKTSF